MANPTNIARQSYRKPISWTTAGQAQDSIRPVTTHLWMPYIVAITESEAWTANIKIFTTIVQGWFVETKDSVTSNERSPADFISMWTCSRLMASSGKVAKTTMHCILSSSSRFCQQTFMYTVRLSSMGPRKSWDFDFPLGKAPFMICPSLRGHFYGQARPQALLRSRQLYVTVKLQGSVWE